ncbi:hypothetical protein KFE25_001675 [Diacronema lutheri]|uniref:Lipid A biosynthesis acyltransferase n=1 Tax=Diacronema lutheri TaxID=2081491 RepID=A0A8J5XK66_DIALT|nr:hypothetical protein KFE25_001675 [Diacronema lutheri]
MAAVPRGFSLAASVLGWCLYTSRWRRAVVEANLVSHTRFLARAAGEGGVGALARRSYAHVALVVASLLRLPAFLSRVPGLTPPPLPRRLLEQLERGAVIFCSAHLGLWELVPHALTPALSPGARAHSAIVYQPLHMRAVDRLVLRRRSRCGIALVPARGSWPRLVAALHAGGIVGIVGDQRPRQRPHSTTFLGRETPFDDGVGRLHALTGAPVWFVAIVCDGCGEHRRLVPHFVELSREDAPDEAGARVRAAGVDNDAGEVRARAARSVVDRYAQVLGEFIARWPEQYLWFHRRWDAGTRQESRSSC